MSLPGLPESFTPIPLPELTPEQTAAGMEIAKFCGFDNEVLKQSMLWNGQAATVKYGLAHSAHYMDYLTVKEIQNAVSKGLEDYRQSQINSGQPH